MSMLQKGCLSVVLGAQWGDEGKGQLSDILCAEAEICARCAVSFPLSFEERRKKKKRTYFTNN